MDWLDKINFINRWIRDGKTHAEKKKRRLIVAAGFAVAGIGLGVSVHWAFFGLLIVTVIKIKNALGDDT